MRKTTLDIVRDVAVAIVYLGLSLGATARASFAQDLSTVALAGDPAPGFEIEQGTFFSFNPASITDTGYVVFEAFVALFPSGFSSAIYRWDPINGLVLVARQGVQSASNGDFDIYAFGADKIGDDQGRVAFRATLDEFSGPNAIFYWENDVLTLLVKDGDPETIEGTDVVTGEPLDDPFPMGTFDLITGPWDIAFNGGKVVFDAALIDLNLGGSANGVWLADPSNACVGSSQCVNLANSLQDAPGAPPPPDRPRFNSFSEVVRNPAGTSGAIARLNSGLEPIAFYRWDSSNSPEFVARGNAPTVTGVLELGMDTVGSFGFRGGFGSANPNDGDNSKSGVFAGFRQVYQERITPAPGVTDSPQALLGISSGHAQTNFGTSVFAARIWQIDGGPPGPFHDMDGLWREAGPGTIELVAHEGQGIASMRGGPSSWSSDQGAPAVIFQTLFGAHVNRQGQLSLWVKKEGVGITPANDEALFAIRGDGSFNEIVSKGDIVVLEDLQAKTISGFLPLDAFSQPNTFVNGPGTEGRAHALNTSGDLAMTINFLDGTSGVFILPLGELMVIDSPKLVALEVNQVIQDWENSVTLTEDKKTIVRAHLESPQDVLIAPILRGRRNSLELPESPLVPANTGLLVPTVPNAVGVRGNLAKNPYFELPMSWTNGTLELELELEGVGIDCQEVTGPSPNDCKATVSFSPVDVLQLRFVRIWYSEDGNLVAPSDYWLADMAKRLISAYPISSLDWNIGVARSSGNGPPSLSRLNRGLKLIRAGENCTEAAGCKRLYYGAILRDGINGLAYLPGTVGSGWVPKKKLAEGRHTHSHEIAHNLGRNHSGNSAYGIWEDGSGTEFILGACCSVMRLLQEEYEPIEDVGAPATTACELEEGETTIVMTNGTRPTLGELDQGESTKIYGMDTLLDRVVDPTRFFDMMSYCSKPGIDFWPGRQTYDALRTAINDRFDPAALQPRLVEGVEIDYLVISGEADLATGEVILDPVAKILGVDSPENPPTGTYTLRLRDGGGSEIQAIPFEPQRFPGLGGPPSTVASFVVFVPDDPDIRQIDVENEIQLAATVSASLNPPTVTVTSPNGGETLNSDEIDLTWEGDDLDGDSLTYLVQFSPDNGSSWVTLATDWSEETLTVDRADLEKTSEGLIRVVASDGFDNAVDTSDGLFTVENNPPSVAISAPVINPLFTSGQQVTFEGIGIDPEDGLIGGASLSWTSDRDGGLGTGSELTVPAGSLSAGRHTITATATDADGGQGTSQIPIYIDIDGGIFFDGFESFLGAWSDAQP